MSAARCKAKSTTTGEQCRKPPTPGTTVCAAHGSKAKQVRAAAKRRLEEVAARKQLAVLGEPIAVDPGAALLGLVHAKAGEVAWLRLLVREVVLRDDDGQELAEPDAQRLVWGMTRQKTGGDDAGTTEEAKPHVLWVMLREAERDLATYATAALKAGIEERRVRLAEDQGLLVAGVIRRTLDGMLDAVLLALRALGLTEVEATARLTEAWRVAVAEVVPRELRALEAGGPT